MTLVDLIKSFMDASKELLKSPISGAFICSFIIYNWRPIAILFFSKASIEDKIAIVNQETYYNKGAIIYPILIALLYTLVIPFVMMGIDYVLTFSKKVRLKRIYKSKEDVIEFKIDLATKILDLKNAESGNKEKQDFLDQIEALKESNTQIIETNKNTVAQLTAKLKQSNEDLKDQLKIDYESLNNNSNNDYGKDLSAGDVLKIKGIHFSPRELSQIKTINSDDQVNFLNISDELLLKLSKSNIVDISLGKVVLTDFGKKFLKYNIY